MKPKGKDHVGNTEYVHDSAASRSIFSSNNLKQ